jgi:acyl-CoA reductase-like NAD-dependent aldehyde dehydrogenase
MPHGGFKQSGYGKDLSSYSLDDYTPDQARDGENRLERGIAQRLRQPASQSRCERLLVDGMRTKVVDTPRIANR